MYIFEEREAAGEALQRVLKEKTAESLAWLDRFEDDPVLAVHETRKNIKRCRALLRLARPGLGELVFRRENYAFRDVGRLFSDLRDREVLLVTFRLLFPPVEGEPAPQELVVFEGRLEAQRDQVYALALETPDRQNSVRQGLLEIRERWDDARPNVSLRQVRHGFSHTWKRAYRQFLTAADEPRTPQKFHEWRKSVKHLWYQHELLTAWAGSDPEFGERTARLDHLSDLLGLAHDAAVLAVEMGRDPQLQPEAHRRVDYFRLDQEGAALLHGARIFIEAPDQIQAH